LPFKIQRRPQARIPVQSMREKGKLHVKRGFLGLKTPAHRGHYAHCVHEAVIEQQVSGVWAGAQPRPFASPEARKKRQPQDPGHSDPSFVHEWQGRRDRLRPARRLLSAYNRRGASRHRHHPARPPGRVLARFEPRPFENVTIHQDSIACYLYTAYRRCTPHNIGGNNASKPQFSMPVFAL
jgi:hypothetical protein